LGLYPNWRISNSESILFEDSSLNLRTLLHLPASLSRTGDLAQTQRQLSAIQVAGAMARRLHLSRSDTFEP